MKIVKSKEKLFVVLMCIALILQFAPIGAQESEEESWSDNTWDNETEAAEPQPAPKSSETVAPKTATETTVPKTNTPKTDGKSAPMKLPKIDGVKTMNTAFDKIVGAISQIGAMFGKTTGSRIGGTSVSAIVMLVVAKLVQDRGPSWLKWVLYLSGGTMVAGSGANITQMIMGFLS